MRTCPPNCIVPPVNRRGVAATEFALVLPVLLVIVLGTIDLGRAFTTSSALANAVCVGAQEAATHRLTDYTSEVWEQRIRTAVVEELQGTPQLNMGQLSLQIDTVTETDGRRRFVVTGGIPFRTVVNWPGIPHVIAMSRSISIEEYR